MSRIRKIRCPECGEPHWFRYWVGEHVAGSEDGICVGDFDLPFHRFRAKVDKLGARRVEHYMVVEIKTGDERLGPAQRDSLSVFNAMLNEMMPVDGAPIGVKSRPGYIKRGSKKVIWHGVHLLRVPRNEAKSGPFFWDNRLIDSDTLVKVLEFENDPRHPKRLLDVDRRHKADSPEPKLPFHVG